MMQKHLQIDIFVKLGLSLLGFVMSLKVKENQVV